jgi:hypothetical protein
MTKPAQHPKYTSILNGHEEAEQLFLKAYTTHRLHHAWLIGGPKGIGKATLAWRMARFILAHPTPPLESTSLSSLFLNPDHHIFLKCAAGSHPDMEILEPGSQNSLIPLETVHTQLSRLQMTTIGTGFRVCLIDSIDNLSLSGINALLKILEEPPPQTLFLIITHRPHNVIPTLRSRCWRLTLRPSSTRAQLNTSSCLATDTKQRSLLDSLKSLICDSHVLPHTHFFQVVRSLTTKDFTLGTLGHTLQTWVMESFRSDILSHSGAVPPNVLAQLEYRVEVWQKAYKALQQTCAVHSDPRPVLLNFLETWRTLTPNLAHILWENPRGIASNHGHDCV